METELLERPQELTVQTRAALALNTTQTEQDLKALAVKNVSIVAVVDKAGREQCHGAAMELKRARTTIEKVSKDAREDATKFSKAVIAEAARLVDIVAPEEIRLINLRDAWDDEQARIKAEAEAKERARITAIHGRIASVRQHASMAADCRTSERIQILIDKLKEEYPAYYFEEFAEEAQEAYDNTLAAMEAMHAQKFADESERIRIKAEQEAQAKVLEEQRAAQEAQAAALAAQRAAFAEEQEVARQALYQEQIRLASERMALQSAQREAEEAKELAAYHAAVVAPVDEPLPMAGHFKEVIAEEPTRPTEAQVINLVAMHYSVDYTTAAQWLDAMEFTTHY